MSPPLEHDYIGLSGASSPASGAAVAAGEGHVAALELKETELRLGLPGSESRERKEKVGHTFGLLPKGLVSGAKRGFSDAIDESEQWVFAGGLGSDGELGKGGSLFPTRGEIGGGGQHLGQGSGGKEAGEQEKKAQVPAAKAQVVGWPPIRSYRKNTMATNPSKNKEDPEAKQGSGCLYVKVSMDGAPYLRKVDLRIYNNYKELSSALEKMFSGFSGGHYGSHGIPGRDGLSESRLMDLLNGYEYVVTYEDKDGDWMLVGDVPWEMFTDSCRRLRIMKGSDAIGLAPRAMEKCKSRT